MCHDEGLVGDHLGPCAGLLVHTPHAPWALLWIGHTVNPCTCEGPASQM